MPSTRRTCHCSLVLLGLALALVAALPETAEAQRRRPAARLVRSPVVVVHAGYPRRAYDRRFRWSQWGPYGYPYPPYGYGYRRDALTTSVRLEVTPREAEVYVDGYLAGVVDDFDGIFQRLRLMPGPHDLVIYLDGYRTIRESLYLSPGIDRKLRFTMAPLPSGESSEPPPAPSDPREADEDGDLAGLPRTPAPVGPRPPATEAPARFGTLSLRIQPEDAEIFVDGERWETPAGSDRVAVQLAEGRHRLEVRKAGFATYAEDVLIRRDSTLSLNVSLTSSPGEGG